MDANGVGALRVWFERCEWLVEESESWDGYRDFGFAQHVLDVVMAMRGGFDQVGARAPVDDVEELGLSVTCDSDGSIDGFVMQCPVLVLVGGEKVRSYVAEWLELDGATTDVGLEGVESAWGIVEALVATWDRLRSVAVAIQVAQFEAGVAGRLM